MTHRTALRAAAAAALVLLAGCANLAPTHERPPSPLAATWPAGAASAPGTAAVTDLPWRDFISDDRLRRVVDETLVRNRDLRIATFNIERARALYRIERSAVAPTVDASLGGNRQRSGTTGNTATQYSASVGMSYEIDLFGRVRNLSESALQTFFAVEENRRSTQISLIGDVSAAWLTLATDMRLLQLSRDTLRSQQSSHDLTRRAHELGGVSGLALAQSQTTVEAARVDVARYTTLVAQDRNALELLAGGPLADDLLPLDVAAGATDATVLVDVPAGLPSQVLQRRPDVIAAEYRLRAANADIGVARAALFPSISLTGSIGRQSRSLSDLFSAGTRVWSFGPQLDLPIFDMGARQSGVAVSQADRDIAIASYEQALQVAFREVADALAVRGTLAERLAAQQALTEASERGMSLSDALYRNGGASYLDVLDAQRALYAARQASISLRLAEQLNRLALYRALGGG